MDNTTIENCSVCIKKAEESMPVCAVQVDGTGLDLAPGTIVLVYKDSEEDEEEEEEEGVMGHSVHPDAMLLSVYEQPCRVSTTPRLTLTPERARIANFAPCTTATLKILPTPVPDAYVLDRVLLECVDADAWDGRASIGSALCGQVACQGTIIRASSSSSFHTLMCDPYLQGVIGEKTKLVVLPPRKPKTERGGDDTSDVPELAEFVVQTSRRFIRSGGCHNTAVVSDAALQRLGIKQGSWVSLTCDGRSRVAQLSSHPMKGEDAGTLYAHPCLLFNMGAEAGSKVCIEEFGRDLPVAQEVHLARVLSAESSGTENYAYELWKYFKTPRAVTVGDVIAVRSHAFASSLTQGLFESSDVRDDYCSPKGPLHKSKARSVLIYFSVTKIVCGDGTVPSPAEQSSSKGPETVTSCIVDRESTKLVQTGVVNSFIPEDAKEVLGESIITCQKPLDDLLKVLKPLVRNKAHRASREMVLLHGPRGTGKRSLCAKAADALGMHHVRVDCYELVEAGEQGTAARLQHAFDDAAARCPPCLLCLDGIEALERPHFNAVEKRETMLVDVLREYSRAPRPSGTVVLVATTPSIDDLRPATRGCFAQQVHSPVPDEGERAHVLRRLLSRVPTGADVSVKDLSIRTASFTLSDLRLLVARAGRTALTERVAKVPCRRDCPEVARRLGLVVARRDFDAALKEIQARQGALIGRPKIPNVRWSDVGGLEDVKQEITDTIRLPLTHGHLFPPGTRHRSGVLLYGPPGTGKTLLAKAVATELSLNFLSVKGPELISMYVGESERNIRAIFQTARDASPCVIFFDELDSLAPKRGAGADSGGVMDRVVSQLLAELDGVQKASSVFVIGATNRPDLVDPALLCPGRFDRLLYLGICPDPEAKLKVITALTSKFRLGEDVDLGAVARACPPRLTGADMYALCSGAMMAALREEIEALNRGERGGPDSAASTGVVVKMSHFLASLKTVVPSVSEQELKYYESLHSKFKSS